jgi:peptide deformylase
MAKLEIVQVGDPILRKPAKEVADIHDACVQQLIADMAETMRVAPGVGLAAPQVGVSLQIAVVEDRPEYLAKVPPEILQQRERQPIPFHVIINPVLSLGEETVDFYEGCLSLPGFTALVPRARAVRVKCWNERGEPLTIDATGWYARILQHEIDHLMGTLYIDRMRVHTFCTLANYERYAPDRV